MKTGKLASKLNKLFEKKSRLKKKQKAKLKDLLHKLRGQQTKLEEKLLSADNEQKRRDIDRELKIIRLQRKKAIQLLIEFKSGNE